MIADLKKELQALSSPQKAKASAWFFKTGKGQYGEGDIFIGVTVPEQRTVAQKYVSLPLSEIEQLLQDKVHEYRLTALFILVGQYKKADESTKKTIYDFYLQHTKYINNWDLVDSSASYIVGEFLLNKERDILYKLAYSSNIWERRISIIATATFIKHNQFEDTFKIAELLLSDSHDLIHKAVGWMLREVGKKDIHQEEQFLDKHSQSMPRTALRYAIEKFSPTKKTYYMKK